MHMCCQVFRPTQTTTQSIISANQLGARTISLQITHVKQMGIIFQIEPLHFPDQFLHAQSTFTTLLSITHCTPVRENKGTQLRPQYNRVKTFLLQYIVYSYQVFLILSKSSQVLSILFFYN